MTGNNLKYDAVCNPACLQSSNAQSVGAKGFGACVDQAYHDVRPVAMVVLRREHHCGTGLCQLRARKRAYDNIAGLQRSSRS